ncbi:MAG TPA: class I SAM-dependent methyltransferase [Streptosporangiaceae bacterium]|nr:class I SAM-dependent methyltransferase [Streptosporangiaceae bacterium]
MGLYRDQLLPRFTHLTLNNREFAKLRARITAGLEGEVLEIGFGSGLNIPHYPAGVTRVWAVDPALVGRKMAAERVAARGVPTDYIGTDAQAIPLADESVDHALSTWTLCTIPDPGKALAEVHRVLRPGGTLHFLEHGLSPDEKVARFQARLTPLHRLIAGGCELNRPIEALVRSAGLAMSRGTTYYTSGPRFTGYTYEGVAAKRR